MKVTELIGGKIRQVRQAPGITRHRAAKQSKEKLKSLHHMAHNPCGTQVK